MIELKVLERDDVKKLVETALIKYAMRHNDIVSVEVIDGVCSWGIGVCPEFSYYAFEDDKYILMDWASDYYGISYMMAEDKLGRNEFPFHLITVWEYDGSDPTGGESNEILPHQHTLDELVSIFYSDYLAYIKCVVEVLDNK